ncbi:MAG: FtsW/RodA/SpoVE family cell cycle protein [Planctomycetota bacterium]
MPPETSFALVRSRLGAFGAMVIISALLLCGIGIVMCASVDSTADKPEGLAWKQASRLLIALPACIAVFIVKPRWIRANAYLLYLFSAALLVAVLFVGPVINGARRWIGIGGFRFQASDLAKIALCLTLARFLSIRSRVTSAWGVAAVLMMVAVPAALILKEPDLGTALSLMPVLVASLLAAGVKRSHLIILSVIVAICLAALAFKGLHGYQRERIDTWWRQSELTRTEKLAQGYHLHRSKIAIGSGGFAGYGYGEGPQNKNDLLPERHTDFAFSVISEEYGFAGAVTVLLLELMIPIGLFMIALRVREPFARIAIVTIGTQIGSQALINIGVATGVFPTTGLALPLVSLGGTSAVVTLVSISTALHLAAHAEPVFAGDLFEPGEEATAFDRPRR